MTIAYKKRQLNFNLFLGLLWFVFFLIQLSTEQLHWLDYGWGVLSLAYFTIYFYQKKYKYLTIRSGVLTIAGPLGKKINLTEIKQITKFAGDYIIKTNTQELTINTQSVAPNSLDILKERLEKLSIE